MALFCNHTKSPNTKKTGVSAGTRETQNDTFCFKSGILGRGLKRGFYYLWYTKAVLCWNLSFYSVFSKTQLCRNKRVQVGKKHKFTKIGGCLPTCMKVFLFFVFILFGGFVFLLACLFFFVWKKAPKDYYPAILEYFSFFVSPKGLSLKPLFSSYPAFFLVFILFPLSKSHLFSLAFVHQPLFGIYYYFLVASVFLFCCLSLVHVCLFISNELS